MLGAYFTDTNDYLILCNWGYPDTDLASVYDFSAVSNSFPFKHYFYIPSTNALSTGVAYAGVATRISTSFNKVAPNSKAQPTAQSQNELIKITEIRLHAAYLKQAQSVNKSVAKNDTIRTNQLQKLLNKMPEISK